MASGSRNCHAPGSSGIPESSTSVLIASLVVSNNDRARVLVQNPPSPAMNQSPTSTQNAVGKLYSFYAS